MPISADAVASNHNADPRIVLEELVGNGSFELPLLPESSSRLIGMCNDPDCPPRELAESIRSDQSIASHVLRVANSSMYSAGMSIVSLQQSVARLGIQRIREIVFIVSCQGRVFDVEGFDDEVRQSFRRSLAAAAFGQELARTRRLNVESAFLCGLLHDVGRPVLLQAVVDYQKRVGVLLDRRPVLDAIETHKAAVGGELIETWNLPQSVADSVRNQSQEDMDHGTQEAKVLRLAIAFTDALLDPDNHEPEALREHRLVQQLNIYPDQLESVLMKSDKILDLIGRA